MAKAVHRDTYWDTKKAYVHNPFQGRTQRGFEGGSPNPAGVWGRCEPPAGSGAEPRKILKLTLFRGLEHLFP